MRKNAPENYRMVDYYVNIIDILPPDSFREGTTYDSSRNLLLTPGSVWLGRHCLEISRKRTDGVTYLVLEGNFSPVREVHAAKMDKIGLPNPVYLVKALCKVIERVSGGEDIV